ncbi:hypothetical protein PK98_08910 [Croceibacterium mercuriale]|uniref:Uncharacterized protein n=1 Tax=Croceibacterium mercuriale TaxID=1572751 RepID=A0A0B2C3A5_9SPHN|nr:hypothetical protein [Croceibacterium mercuriale]KHL26511.1 hypothetical protein PK98_08910 [Croceibacterium mercuriale]
MADQVNENGTEKPAAGGADQASKTQPAAQSGNTGKGDDAEGVTKTDKAEAMEDAQREAAEEREENRGYQ